MPTPPFYIVKAVAIRPMLHLAPHMPFSEEARCITGILHRLAHGILLRIEIIFPQGSGTTNLFTDLCSLYMLLNLFFMPRCIG